MVRFSRCVWSGGRGLKSFSARVISLASHPARCLICPRFSDWPGTALEQAARCGLVPVPRAHRVLAGCRVLVWWTEPVASAASSSSAAAVNLRDEWAALCERAGAQVVHAPRELLKEATRARAHAACLMPPSSGADSAPVASHQQQQQRRRDAIAYMRTHRAATAAPASVQRAALACDVILVVDARAECEAARAAADACDTSAKGASPASQPRSALVDACLGPLAAWVRAATRGCASSLSQTPTLVDKQYLIDCLVLQRRCAFDECDAYAPARGE